MSDIPPEAKAMFREALNNAVDRFLRDSDLPLALYFMGLNSGAISALVNYAGMDVEEARAKGGLLAEVAATDPIAREQLRETLIRTLNGEQDGVVKVTAYGVERSEGQN